MKKDRNAGLADDTKRAIMTDMGHVELEKHLLLNPDRVGATQRVAAAFRDYVEQLHHKADPMDIGETAPLDEDEYEGGWDEVYVVGRAKGKGKAKGRGISNAPRKSMANQQTSREARDRKT